METCLRVMNSQDTKAVMALEAACFSDPWTWGIIKDLPDSPWDETWLLEDERGTLLGYLTCRFLAGEGELMRIAVFPEFRGQGYSRELMDRMEKSAAEKAVNALSLEVRAGNEVVSDILAVRRPPAFIRPFPLWGEGSKPCTTYLPNEMQHPARAWEEFRPHLLVHRRHVLRKAIFMTQADRCSRKG